MIERVAREPRRGASSSRGIPGRPAVAGTHSALRKPPISRLEPWLRDRRGRTAANRIASVSTLQCRARQRRSHLSRSLRLRGPLDPAAVERAVASVIVERHEILARALRGRAPNRPRAPARPRTKSGVPISSRARVRARHVGRAKKKSRGRPVVARSKLVRRRRRRITRSRRVSPHRFDGRVARVVQRRARRGVSTASTRTLPLQILDTRRTCSRLSNLGWSTPTLAVGTKRVA